MTAPSIGVKDILVAASLGVFTSPSNSDWNIKISKLVDEPDRVIAIFDVGGNRPDPRWLLDYPHVQVMVRGKTYGETFTKMKDVFDALQGRYPGTVNGDNWDGIFANTHPAHIGYDEKDRPIFSVTFKLFVEPANVAGDNRDVL